MSLRTTARAAIEPTSEPTGRTATVLRTLARHERTLWAVAAFALIGDVLLTHYGLSVGLAERNPVAASTLAAHGWTAMLALKLPGTLLALAWRAVLPAVYRGVIPSVLALPWLVAVGVNAGVILQVV